MLPSKNNQAQGKVITRVTIGSAAAKAGFMPDDVILKMGGATARTLSALATAAAETMPGQPVPVEISRHGARQKMSLLVDQFRH